MRIRSVFLVANSIYGIYFAIKKPMHRKRIAAVLNLSKNLLPAGLFCHLLFWGFSAVAAPSCTGALVDSETPVQIALNSDQLAAISEVIGNTTDLKITVLNQMVDGQPKTVVLLGETHGGTSNDNSLGPDLANKFQHVGLEGHPTEWRAGNGSYWAMPLASLLIAPKKLYYALMSSISKTPRNPDVSTIAIVTGQSRKGKFRIEQGHIPTAAENLSTLSLGIESSSQVFCLAACTYHAMASLVTLNAHQGVIAAAFAAGYGFSAKIAYPQIIRWFEKAQTKDRDLTMAANIKHFFASSTQNTLLVIVGRGHIPGVVKQLTSSYEFQEVDLSALEDPSPILN